MSQANQKKKLRVNAQPFNPTQDSSYMQQPYAPVIQQYYPPQQNPYQNFQNPQAYQGPIYNQPPPFNNSQPYYPQQAPIPPIPQKPQEQQIEKPKEKKPLLRSAKPFETDNEEKKKKEQEEKEKELERQRQEQQEQERQQQLLKQQEEERIQQERIKERLPRAYNQQEMFDLLARYELEDFEYFQQAQWRIILGRQVYEIKEKERKNNDRNNQQRKSTINKEQYNNNNQRTPQQPRESVQFNKGTNVQALQAPTNQPSTSVIQITRRVEDVTTKLKRDEMRTNLDWLNKQKEKDDEKQTAKKDVKFWLNIISPDNYEVFADKLHKALINNPDLSEYFADRILEKSQTESKYREIYSNLCSKLIKEPTIPNPNGKPFSVFRSSILDRVQKGFEQRKAEQQQAQNLTPEQKAQFHIIRKNRIMGNVRFIGDLYKKQVLPQKVVIIAFQELISDFLEQFVPNQKDEEELEGIVELLDQIGQFYEQSKSKQNNQNVQQNVDEAELLKVFDGKQKSKAETGAFFQKYEKVTSLDFMFRILHLVKKQYKVSVRVSILIDNLDDRRAKGWKETIHQQGESAKSTSQIQQETYQQEQKDRERQPSYIPKKQPVQKQQYVEYVAKQQEPEVDYSEISQRIEIAFKLKSTDPQVLSDDLKDGLKNVGKDLNGQIIFYEEFFKKILKASKQNLERAQIVQTLVSSDLTILDAVLQSSKKVFTNEDFVYDLIESRYGAELFVDIIVHFLNEEMYEQLNYLYFRPQDDNEEYQEFFTKVILELIKDCPDKQEQILKYSEKALKFKIEVN